MKSSKLPLMLSHSPSPWDARMWNLVPKMRDGPIHNFCTASWEKPSRQVPPPSTFPIRQDGICPGNLVLSLPNCAKMCPEPIRSSSRHIVIMIWDWPLPILWRVPTMVQDSWNVLLMVLVNVRVMHPWMKLPWRLLSRETRSSIVLPNLVPEICIPPSIPSTFHPLPRWCKNIRVCVVNRTRRLWVPMPSVMNRVFIRMV
mmetsp:Transcript_26267/g.36836  ORF Transcript_26267/g.36836 Transcript_26267/m.36836 type:complete len:200 (+) Transcript_26267:706-1305(+)